MKHLFAGESSIREASASSAPDLADWVPETRFGNWFLGTGIWHRYVLGEAVATLRRLIGDDCPDQARLLDAGCGQGQSFDLLWEAFRPGSICAFDIDRTLLDKAGQRALENHRRIEPVPAHAADLPWPDNRFDLVFCHQLLHHVHCQREVLDEFYRVLKPGGRLLLSESCKPFLDVYWVKLLFRHPRMRQLTAGGYRALVEAAGFSLSPDTVAATTPWWSRRDFGLLEKWGLPHPSPAVTEIALVATKPCGNDRPCP